MPGSSNIGKLAIARWYDALPLTPRLLLDIGPGWGTFAKLFRRSGQRWDAVEIHAPYVTAFRLRKLYDHIYVQDAVSFVPCTTYDIVFFGDVLEHVRFDDAQKMLRNLLPKCRFAILSIPLDAETGADLENASDYWQNAHERHLHRWDNRAVMHAIERCGGEIVAMEKYEALGVYVVAGTAQLRYVGDWQPSLAHLLRARMTRKYDYDPRRLRKFVQSLRDRVTTAGGRVTPETIKKVLRRVLRIT